MQKLYFIYITNMRKPESCDPGFLWEPIVVWVIVRFEWRKLMIVLMQ